MFSTPGYDTDGFNARKIQENNIHTFGLGREEGTFILPIDVLLDISDRGGASSERETCVESPISLSPLKTVSRKGEIR